MTVVTPMTDVVPSRPDRFRARWDMGSRSTGIDRTRHRRHDPRSARECPAECREAWTDPGREHDGSRVEGVTRRCRSLTGRRSAPRSCGWSDITIQPSRGERGFSSFQRSFGGARSTERADARDTQAVRPRASDIAGTSNDALLTLEKIAQQPARPRARLRAGRALVDRGHAGSTAGASRRRSTGSSTPSPMPTTTCSTPTSPTAAGRPTPGSGWPARSTTRASNG